MPTSPSTWTSGQPVAAGQLNADLYTFNTGFTFPAIFSSGSTHQPNGLLFHSTPPLVVESLATSGAGSQTSSSGGSTKSVRSAGSWRSILDNAALFSAAGSDLAGLFASGQFKPVVAGSGGDTTHVGGIHLAWGTASFVSTSNSGGSGALLYYGSGSTTAAFGGIGRSSTTQNNSAYVADLQTMTSPNFANLGGYCADTSGSSFSYSFNGTDYMNQPCLFGTLWSGNDPSVNATVAGSLPVPTTGYTGISTITTAGMNGNNLAGPLKFLNAVPQLRASSALTTSITASASPAATVVPLTSGTGDLDNWAGWSSSNHQYTVPVSGVYLVHGSVSFASNSASSAAGIKIGSTVLWGPGHSGAGSGITKPQIIRLVDLNAGDVVSLVASITSTTSLSSSQTCRLVIRFMSAQAASSGSVAWTPPDTGYRWQAGSPGSQLPTLFNAHLGNDLSFLIQRPYLMAWQSTLQSGLAHNAFSTTVMQTLGGRVHSTAGDNYGGWTSGSSNRYAAVVPGWYLVVANYTQALPGSTAQAVAGCGYFLSGGTAQGSSSTQGGQQVQALTTGYPPGAELISAFYLRAGDFVQPQYSQLDGSATYSTSVTNTGQESSFGCVWISE